jgi:hypothetical protein
MIAANAQPVSTTLLLPDWDQFDPMSSVTPIIESLSLMPQQFEALYRLAPTRQLRWVPASWEGVPGERFSVAEQACHIRDIEIDGYHVRFHRLIAEEHPELVSFDSYELARTRRYEQLDPEEAIHAFREARRKTIHLLMEVTPEQLQRSGTFGEYGRVTLHGLAHFLCSHDRQHLACMHWLLGKIHSLE